MKDIILEKFFEPQRWAYALSKGVDKDIRKDQLYQLTKEETRITIASAMRQGKYRISPPHTAQIPKDTPGEFRTVYVNEPVDRVMLSIANDLLFELMPEMIHPRCTSYQKGIGCGKVVQEVSHKICTTSGEIVGWKSDLSKYFDSVPLKYIDKVFDRIEAKYGESALIWVIRDYYHSDWYFNEDNELQCKFQSLKQGCAVAAFLADAILYELDAELASLRGYYVRYSDDMVYFGEDYKVAMEILRDRLGDMQMSLNPKKVEYVTHDTWVKFLGYSIRGKDISMSPNRLKTFQKEIERRTIRCRGISFKRALNQVNRYLYKGNNEFSWATQILPVVNVKEDLDILNEFVMDCLRAVQTGKRKVGGLGYLKKGCAGCVVRGVGRNVKANRAKTEKELEGYLSLGCAQKAMVTSREVYRTLVASL